MHSCPLKSDWLSYVPATTATAQVLSSTHLHNTFLPAADNFLFTDLELKWFVTVTGRVEFPAIRQRAWKIKEEKTRPEKQEMDLKR